ncbi:hypothetical protein [Enterobacter cloacae]|uniref:hypothetical protein n=1 Tax=Enterobacter cloacae TaxID=550 RepID=UPI001E438F5D|nr:hypothetical protein [Enterobacter cloacae]
MLITDLFSHKIHSSGDDWPEKLIDIATIFNRFDGQPYDREAIERELLKISPRATKVARDASKFRDEISAYPAYLGLYRLEVVNGAWHVFMSATAKRFLVNEEPNVSAFLLLQLSLFQYPNGMGVAYTSGGTGLRIQANTRERTLSFIKHNVHLAPLRLIIKILTADAVIGGIDLFEAKASFEEIFLCANDSDININASPELSLVINKLNHFRNKGVQFLDGFERRFHILKHTGIFEIERASVKLKKPITKIERKTILERVDVLNNLETQFDEFNIVSTEHDLKKILETCSWSKYFDAVKTLDQETVYKLTYESYDLVNEQNDFIDNETSIEVVTANKLYEFKEYGRNSLPKKSINKNPVYIDPELTKIKRQRANLTHKVLLDKLNQYLVSKGATTHENEHVDLFAKFESNDKYLFEVKSIDDKNLLSQTRKGISQLYEYRYRYQEMIGYDVKLCLVYPYEPKVIPWLQRYLCEDREVYVLWFDEDTPIFSECCNQYAPKL